MDRSSAWSQEAQVFDVIMRMRRFMMVLALVALPIAVLAGHGQDSSHHVRLVLTVENPLPHALKEQRVWMYAPADQGDRQELVKLEVGGAYKRSQDDLGNTIIEIPLDPLAPFATKVIRVDAQVRVRGEGEREALKHPEMFLGNEPFLDTDDPDIRKLAAQLKRPNASESAHAIYDWVRENLTYAGFTANEMGATYALQHRRGDCTEYADLVAALARVNALPARVMGGFVADGDIAPRAREYHNWAEIYIDGAWHVVDAQKRVFMDTKSQYVAFRVGSTKIVNQLGMANRFRVDGEILAKLD